MIFSRGEQAVFILKPPSPVAPHLCHFAVPFTLDDGNFQWELDDPHAMQGYLVG